VGEAVSLSNSTFTPEQRRVLSDLGFTDSWDLTSQVFYKAIYESTDRWMVICADGTTYTVEGIKDIEDALGTY
jgi:hypothetical protein